MIAGVRSLIDRYDLVLVDAWGVLHDGGSVFPGSLNCLESLADSKIPVVVVSNAARRNALVDEELVRTGVAPHLFHSVESSGEMTWQALSLDSRHRQYGEHGYYLGPPRSQSLCDGIGKTWTQSLQEADFVLNAGAPCGNPVTTESLDPVIADTAELGLPMVCANPDLVAIRAGRAGICAGAIAARYLELGGRRLVRFGKPDKAIFDRAMRAFPQTPKHRVLMIGDGLDTDITGAGNAGIDSLLIAGGIHRDWLSPLNNAVLAECATRYNVCPAFACETLKW